jgi:fluoroacetyl-CoA thioesterase
MLRRHERKFRKQRAPNRICDLAREVSRSITPSSFSRKIPRRTCLRQALSMYFRLPVAIYASTAGTPPREDDCMRQIPLGTKGTFTLRVLAEHLADRFKDAMLPQVLATPVMILIMENAALAAIRPFLDVGESAVGTAINVRHLAATPVGHDVRAEAEVVKVEGKRIEFMVTASDETEVIGSGTHQRMVIDLPSFNERLAKKRKR